MMPQSQLQHQYLPPMSQPSTPLKILTCCLLIGIGVALGTMFSSYISPTTVIPFSSVQSLQLAPPSPPTDDDPEPPPSIQEEPSTQEPPQAIQIQEPIEQEPSLPPPQQQQRRLGLGDYLAPRDVMHGMSDAELLWRASMVPKVAVRPYRRIPKVAFMFLARGDLPFRPLWEMFFQGHEGLFSVYLHLSPAYRGTVPARSVFLGRRIPSKVIKLVTNFI